MLKSDLHSESNKSAESSRGMVTAVVATISLVALLLRYSAATRGGIWADEAFFMLIVNSPTWSSMFEFLRLHESHPPFFYVVMRAWVSVAGDSDLSARILPVATGVAIVPVMYVIGERLYSRRAGIIAAFLAAISPPLIEFSSQLRPYGILALLVLASCFALINVVANRQRGWWVIYVVTTALMLYTHNWVWLVVGGQGVAMLIALIDARGIARREVMWRVLPAWIAIALLYAPWIPTLLFQIKHAGHPPSVVGSLTQSFRLWAFAAPASFAMLMLGSIADRAAAASVIAGAIVISVGIFAYLRHWMARTRSTAHGDRTTRIDDGIDERLPGIMLLAVPVAAIVAAIAMSSRTNMLLPRCVSMLTPLSLLLIARLVSHREQKSSTPGPARQMIIRVTALALITVFISRDWALATTPRSNVMSVASTLDNHIRPTDLVVVAPEWYAASLDRYLESRVEQIVYPHAGRSGPVDFSNVLERVADPAPLAALRSKIDNAQRDRRRVWLITGRPYSRDITPRDVQEAVMYRQTAKFSLVRVNQIRRSLTEQFGDADTSYFARGAHPLYDELLPYLFTPVGKAGPR